MKDCESAPGLGWNYFSRRRDENGEPVYTCNDKYIRYFVKQSIKGGQVCAFFQYYVSNICDEVIKVLSEELNVKRNVYHIIEAYIKYKNIHSKIIREEYENEFADYRDIDEDEMNDYINKKLGEHPLQKLLQELPLNDLIWDFDAVSLYHSTMSDPKSIYLRIETSYAHTKVMNDKFVKKINNQYLTQGSAIFTVEYFSPKNLTIQHLTIKERVKKMENILMRNCYFVDTLTSVDIQKSFKLVER